MGRDGASLAAVSEMGGGVFGAAAPRALCAIHVETPAVGTCTRCGNYMCTECTGDGRFEMCPACRERLGVGDFPFSRNEWSVGGLFNLSWERFKQHWPLLVVATLIFFGVSTAMSFVFQGVTMAAGSDPVALAVILAVSQITQNVVNLALSLFMIQVTLDAVLGRGVDLGRALRAMIVLWKALVQYVVLIPTFIPILLVVFLPMVALDDEETALLIAMGGMLVLFFPLIYVWLGLFSMQYEIVHDASVGPIEAMRRSWNLARHQRWYIFGVGVLAGLIMMGGVLLCCVGILASYPLALMLFASLYLALRNGSGLPEPRARDAM